MRSAKLLPDDYEDYRLCKAFGWKPSELDDEDAITIIRYKTFLDAELEYESFLREQAKGNA